MDNTLTKREEASIKRFVSDVTSLSTRTLQVEGLRIRNGTMAAIVKTRRSQHTPEMVDYLRQSVEANVGHRGKVEHKTRTDNTVFSFGRKRRFILSATKDGSDVRFIVEQK